MNFFEPKLWLCFGTWKGHHNKTKRHAKLLNYIFQLFATYMLKVSWKEAFTTYLLLLHRRSSVVFVIVASKSNPLPTVLHASRVPIICRTRADVDSLCKITWLDDIPPIIFYTYQLELFMKIIGLNFKANLSGFFWQNCFAILCVCTEKSVAILWCVA